MRQSNASIEDIARRAGVGRSTVSRVINNSPDVSKEARTRVSQAIKDLDYRPSLAARHLRTQRSQTIGFITDMIATTPFAGNIIKGAQDLAWENGKVLLVINTGSSPEIEEAAIETMLERRVEGIIYAAMYHRVVDPPASIRKGPPVLLDCFCADGSLPSVVPDEVGGGRCATEVLLRKGHRRIAFINLSLSIAEIAAVGRLEGYRQALESYAVPFDEALLRYGNAQADSGYEYTMELMRLPEPPTAIFCGNDRIAMGCYLALKELGLHIPRDVAVIGFDNQRIIAKYLKPPLSTIALPHYKMGRWAVQYLIDQGGNVNSAGAPIQHRLDCPYISRKSV